MSRSGHAHEGRVASRAVQGAFRVALVVLLYLATTRWRVSPLLLPNPAAVLRDFWDILKTGEFIGDLRVTLTELAAAFAIAASCGVVVGYVISRSQYRIRVFEPLFAGIYSVPIILFLPLYVLFFGLGPASKIALGATIGFFPIALNTVAGFGYVDRVLVVAARSMGASDVQLFRYVLLPAALPIILTGMRMGFTVALLSIIGSETIASLAGLGHRIVHLAEGMEMARMFAYIAFVVAIAAILNTLVSMLEARGNAGDGRERMAAGATATVGRAHRRCRAPARRLGGRRALVGRSDVSEPAVACVRLAAGGIRYPRRSGGLARHVLGARRRLRALGRDRARDRACRWSTAVLAPELQADHPLALRHAASHHSAAVHSLFRHRPGLQNRLRREPRLFSHRHDHRRRCAEHQADPAHECARDGCEPVANAALRRFPAHDPELLRRHAARHDRRVARRAAGRALCLDRGHRLFHHPVHAELRSDPALGPHLSARRHGHRAQRDRAAGRGAFRPLAHRVRGIADGGKAQAHRRVRRLRDRARAQGRRGPG